MKPFLKASTVDKVRIFGFNQDEWKAALLEEIDADQLPVYYGGTKTMTDESADAIPKVISLYYYIKMR